MRPRTHHHPKVRARTVVATAALALTLGSVAPAAAVGQSGQGVIDAAPGDLTPSGGPKSHDPVTEQKGSMPRPAKAEHFTGSVNDFYVVPADLAPGRPGELIRYQDVGTDNGRVTLRVMYHSTDSEGRDRAVTGLVTYPTAKAPKGGWPVVSFAHGTSGIAEQCAPSRWSDEAPSYGVQGVAVATDYIGLGPVGEVHSYLNGLSEGNAMVDAVRAAQKIPAAHAGRRWFSVGGSQGGHAALWGGERSAAYAPELELLGIAAMAPPAAFDQTFGSVDEVVARIIGVMMIYGGVIEHPAIDPATYASAPVAAASGVLKTGCLDKIQDTYIPLAVQGPAFWKVDPRTVEPTRSFMLAQEPSLVVTDKPYYISSGTADIQVNFNRERILVERICDKGQVVEFHEFAGADHGQVFTLSAPGVTQWLQDRLAGKPAPNSCNDPARPRP